VVAVGSSQDSGQLFLLLVTGGHSSLDVIEEYLRVAAVEGVNARSGWTASAALEAKELGVETVAPEGSQRPADRRLTPLIQYQVGLANFQLARTQTPTRIVHVHHLLMDQNKQQQQPEINSMFFFPNSNFQQFNDFIFLSSVSNRCYRST
jgi:hypothetical protein